MRTPSNRIETIDEDDASLKIYCDTSWMPEVEVRGRGNVLVNAIVHTGLTLGIIGNKFSCKTAQAVTWPLAPLGGAAITLCPWFVDRIDENVTLRSRRKIALMMRMWRWIPDLVEGRLGLTQFDHFYWPSIVIFHEVSTSLVLRKLFNILQLMHTIDAGLRRDLEDNKSYKWVDVVRIGRRPDNWNNAQNLAYFALGNGSKSIRTK